MRRLRYPFLLCVLLLPLAAAQANTAIVGIRTPEAVVVAADSKATFQGVSTFTRTVCKIYQAESLFFAVSGLANDLGRGFSAPHSVAAGLAAGGTFAERVGAAEAHLLSAMTAELGRLKAEDPRRFEQALDVPEGQVVAVLVFGLDGTVPAAAGFTLKLSSARPGSIQMDVVRLACPGDCPDGTLIFSLGHREAIDRFRNDPANDLRQMSLEQTARFLVELEVKDRPDDVGLPVDVLRIDSNGATWSPPRPGCPEPVPALYPRPLQLRR
jgi:hypothetical protein